jgi:hypothetical protein
LRRQTAVNAAALKPELEANASISIANVTPMDAMIKKWLDSIVTPDGLPHSYQANESAIQQYYQKTGDMSGAMYLRNGSFIYDASLAQLFWAMHDMRDQSKAVTDRYWYNVRPGGGDLRLMNDPAVVYNQSEPGRYLNNIPGKRGFLPHVIDLSGKAAGNIPANSSAEWHPGLPFSGANVWAGIIAPLQAYYAKYGAVYLASANEIRLAEEIAAAGMDLQVIELGGIRMAPYGQVLLRLVEYNFTENMDGWLSAFNMLTKITGKDVYARRAALSENYFKAVYIPDSRMFGQGMSFDAAKGWIVDPAYSTDAQVLTICSLSPEKIDRMFGRARRINCGRRLKRAQVFLTGREGLPV